MKHSLKLATNFSKFTLFYFTCNDKMGIQILFKALQKPYIDGFSI